MNGLETSLFQMIRREPVSKACDVYSYGIFAWEIVTKKKPFSDVKEYMVPMKVAEGEVGVLAFTSELVSI